MVRYSQIFGSFVLEAASFYNFLTSLTSHLIPTIQNVKIIERKKQLDTEKLIILKSEHLRINFFSYKYPFAQ